MHLVQRKTFNEVNNQLAVSFLNPENVRTTNPRNLECYEFTDPVCYKVENLWDCWLTIPYRRLNPFFAAAEVFWILSGDGRVDWISRFNKTMLKFADKDSPYPNEFNAPYGKRMFNWQDGYGNTINQYKYALNCLTLNPDTRQAVIGIWNPLKDTVKVTNDRACNNVVYFSLRDNRLNITVCQRSNDFYLGTPYNSLQFAHLAMLMCGDISRRLNKDISLGYRIQYIQNLHLYTNNFYEADKVKYVLANPFNELSQEYVNSPITYTEFYGNYLYLDKCCGEESLVNIEHRLKLQRENAASIGAYYWIELATIPALYYLYKRDKCSPEEVVKFLQENKFNPLFIWLATDFWKAKLEGAVNGY